jgi:hypothetical protein
MTGGTPDGHDDGAQSGLTRGNIMLDPQFLAESAVGASTLTFDRAVATAAAVVALAGAVMGGLALLRPAGGGSPRNSRIALATGVVGVVVGVWVLATADGGPGTGNGVIGGYAGVLFGLLAVLLGGLVLARSRSRT